MERDEGADRYNECTTGGVRLRQSWIALRLRAEVP